MVETGDGAPSWPCSFQQYPRTGKSKGSESNEMSSIRHLSQLCFPASVLNQDVASSRQCPVSGRKGATRPVLPPGRGPWSNDMPEPDTQAEERRTLADSEEPSSAESQLTFLLREHEYLSDAITFADQKAGVVFAITVGAMTLGANMHQYDGIAGDPFEWARHNVIAAAGIIGILAAAAITFGILLPRFRSGRSTGIVYWQHLVDHGSSQVYSRKVRTITDRELIRDLSSHCYDLAAIARTKFSLTRWALWTGAIGGLLTIVAFTSTDPADTSGAQTGLSTIDRAAVKVLVGLELDRSHLQLGEDVAALGVEIRARPQSLSARQTRLLNQFASGYRAASELVRIQASDSAASIASRQTAAESKLHNDATRLLEQAHKSYGEVHAEK
jgi:hypothetical protein